MILGLIDLEANYLVVKAYQYTTLTSIQVLGALLSFCPSVLLNWGLFCPSKCSLLSV